MYIFNRITVVPQLPKRIEKLAEIANNLWWSWNTEFLKLFKMIDLDLWERIDKNPTKFLKLVSQEKIEKIVTNTEFLNAYDKVVCNYDSYIFSKDTWFTRNHPNNKKDSIAYFYQKVYDHSSPESLGPEWPFQFYKIFMAGVLL